MKDKNVLVLAYLGDSVYEIYVRNHLINKKIGKVKDLQSSAITYVSAKNQRKYLMELISSSFFNEDELALIYRARNHKGLRHPKGTDIITYKHATSLEAVIGALYLENKIDRIDKIMNEILGD